MSRTRGRGRRRGSIVVIVAISAVVLLMFLGLAVDVGLARTASVELHAVTDAGALAGASALGRPDQVRLRARVVTEANAVTKQAIELSDDQIEIGWWDDSAESFTPDPAGDAVRVSAPFAVSTSFASVAGYTTLDFARASVARALLVGVNCGLVGSTVLEVSGTGGIDSYDSTAGAYGGANENANAGLCSNSDITVWGNATVWGDTGAGWDKDTIVGGSGEVSGDLGWLPQPIEVPAVDWDGIAASNDNAAFGLAEPDRLRSLSQGGTVRLGPGRFWIGDLRITGQGTLEIEPPVELYVDGQLDAAGQGIVNVGADPAGLTVYVRGPEAKLRGGSDFYGSVIAPEARVEFRGTADFYGVLLARELDLSGTGQLHMDESLPTAIRYQMHTPPKLVR